MPGGLRAPVMKTSGGGDLDLGLDWDPSLGLWVRMLVFSTSRVRRRSMGRRSYGYGFDMRCLLSIVNSR